MRGLALDLGAVFGLTEPRDATSRLRGTALIQFLMAASGAVMALLLWLSPYGERALALWIALCSLLVAAAAVRSLMRLSRARRAQPA